jgi:hypothetical protein
VKIPGALFAVGVVLASLPEGAPLLARLRRSLQVAVVAGGVLLLSGLPAGLGVGWFSALSVPDFGRVHLAVVALLADAVRSIANAAGAGAIADAFSAKHASTAATVIALAVATAVLARWRTGSDRRVLAGGALAMVAVTVLSPVVHYWYFLWCLPVLCALQLPRRWAWAVVAEVGALGIAAVCDPAFQITWLSVVGEVLVFAAPVVGYLVGRGRLDQVVTDR